MMSEGQWKAIEAVVPAKAGTHTPFILDRARRMGPGSRADALGRDDRSLSHANL
jgi:hypothetical protein